MIKGLLKATFVLGINSVGAGFVTLLVRVGSASLGHNLTFSESLVILMLALILGLQVYQITDNKS